MDSIPQQALYEFLKDMPQNSSTENIELFNNLLDNIDFIQKTSTDFKKLKEEIKEEEKTNHLWDLAEQNILPMIFSRCTVNIDLKLNNHKLRCFLDTGSHINVISEKLIKQLNLESFVDRTHKGEVSGVGQSQINGCIPYIELEFNNHIMLPSNFHIMDSIGSHDILLGLPFMTFYQVNLDFQKRKAKISGMDFNLIIEEA